MTIKQIIITRLVADSGHFITEASDDIDIKDRSILSVVNLSPNDSADNWKEITDQEAAEIEYQKMVSGNNNEEDVVTDADR